MKKQPTENQQPDPPPPFFKSWNGWYALVLLNLAALILLVYAFTRYFQ